jgi:hypothetical protein
MTRLEDPMELIGLARAAELSGLSPETLRILARKGRLKTVKPSTDHLTTRAWLHEYLTSRGPRRRTTKPLPADYVAPV